MCCPGCPGRGPPASAFHVLGVESRASIITVLAGWPAVVSVVAAVVI